MINWWISNGADSQHNTGHRKWEQVVIDHRKYGENTSNSTQEETQVDNLVIPTYPYSVFIICDDIEIF